MTLVNRDCKNVRGDLETPEEFKERFFYQVVPVTESGCWIWVGYCRPHGYGAIRFRGKRTSAHRVAYILLKGEVPNGLTLDHLCRVRCCVNPDHLDPVTIKTNVLRGISPTAVNASRTFCKHGHPFDEINTKRKIDFKGKPFRQCRACNRLLAKIARQKERGNS